jgi:hypothetical protein
LKKRVETSKMGKQIWRGKGRDGRVLGNLVRIAMLHTVDGNRFFGRIADAWNQSESGCAQKLRSRF